MVDLQNDNTIQFSDLKEERDMRAHTVSNIEVSCSHGKRFQGFPAPRCRGKRSQIMVGINSPAPGTLDLPINNDLEVELLHFRTNWNGSATPPKVLGAATLIAKMRDKQEKPKEEEPFGSPHRSVYDGPVKAIIIHRSVRVRRHYR